MLSSKLCALGLMIVVSNCASRLGSRYQVLDTSILATRAAKGGDTYNLSGLSCKKLPQSLLFLRLLLLFLVFVAPSFALR